MVRQAHHEVFDKLAITSMPLKSLDLILSLSKDEAWISAFFSILLNALGEIGSGRSGTRPSFRSAGLADAVLLEMRNGSLRFHGRSIKAPKIRAGLFSKWGAIAAVAILVAVQAAAVSYLGRNNYLPEAPSTGLKIGLFTIFPSALISPIRTSLLVVVDAESLKKAGVPTTVPVDRGWMAELITAVSEREPAAIGLDFYFTSVIDPVKDEQLTTAIRDSETRSSLPR